MDYPNLGQWLREMCLKEKLSLRKAAEKTGISHTTIGLIMKGAHAAPNTISKLAAAFSDGEHHQQALEDELFTLGGYRKRLPSEEYSEPLARLVDLLVGLEKPQLKLVLRFVEFLGEIAESDRSDKEVK